MVNVWISLSDRFFLKEKKRNQQLPLFYAFESVKLLVVVGQRVSLFIVSNRKRISFR